MVGINVTLWDNYSPFSDCYDGKPNLSSTFNDLSGCHGLTVDIGRIIFDKIGAIPTFTEMSTSFCPIENCKGENQTLSVPTSLLKMGQGEFDLGMGVYGITPKRLKLVKLYPLHFTWFGILGCSPMPNFSKVW